MEKPRYQSLLKKWSKLSRGFRIALSLIIAWFLFVISYYASVSNEVGNLAVYHYGNSILLYLTAAITGMGATMFVSHAIVLLNIKPLSFILTYFGKNTLIILLTHLDFYILITAMRISERLPLINSRLVFRLPAILFFTLLIEVPVIEIINRFFPFLIGKSKKSPSKNGKAS